MQLYFFSILKFYGFQILSFKVSPNRFPSSEIPHIKSNTEGDNFPTTIEKCYPNGPNSTNILNFFYRFCITTTYNVLFFWTSDLSRTASNEISLVCLSVCLSLRLSVGKFSQDWISNTVLILYLMMADHDI